MKKIWDVIPVAASLGGAAVGLSNNNMAVAVGFVNLAFLTTILNKLYQK
jgi:hypothetical protein